MTNAINNLVDGSYVDERFNVYINTLTDLKYYITFYDNNEEMPDDIPKDIDAIIDTLDYEYTEGWIEGARQGVIMYPTVAQTYEKLFDIIITRIINKPIWDIPVEGMNMINNWFVNAQLYKQQHGIYRDVGQNVSPFIDNDDTENDDTSDISNDEDPYIEIVDTIDISNDEDPCD